MPLMDPEYAAATAKELLKLKGGSASAKRYFGMGIKGVDAYLIISRTKVKTKELMALRKEHRCQVIVDGRVHWNKELGVYSFRVRKYKLLEKRWEKLKREIGKASSQFKKPPFKDAELLPWKDVAEAKTDKTVAGGEDRSTREEVAQTGSVEPEQAKSALNDWLLYQQEILRDGKGQIDGRISASELNIRDAQGEPVQWTAELLAQLGMDGLFELDGKGGLVLHSSLLKDGVVQAEELTQVAGALVGVVEKGYQVGLSHDEDPDRGTSLELERSEEGIEQTVIHKEGSARDNLRYDRGAEVVPGSDPAISFEKLIDTMTAAEGKEFQKMNQVLGDAYELEKAQGLVNEDMSFQQYKMQFVDLQVDAVDENGLAWHDGDGELNAAEWAFLKLKVDDLPDEEQHYNWARIKWTRASGEEVEIERRVALDEEPATIEAVKRSLAKDGWRTSGLDIELLGYDYSIPGKKQLAPKLTDFPPGVLKTVLSDESGQIPGEAEGSTVDLADPDQKAAAQLKLAKEMGNTVMRASLKRWTENSGEAIGSLISKVPDTQKIFLRQSNGVANSERVDGQEVGQTDVIDQGNDTGAYGKCAPVSYFSAAITGIGVGTRDGLDLLKASPKTSKSADKMEKLLTSSPMNEAAHDAIHAQIETLRQAAAGDAALLKAVGQIEQMVISVVDRMVVKEDEEGPYMEMEFEIPPPQDDYTRKLRMQSGTRQVKVRPADIQEYLEQTNRADSYRGGKKHMMDFYKDPSSMNQVELMEHLGPGIIAVGVDKALKEAGKKSGLLYGPGAAMVNTMVYNKSVRSGGADLKEPVAGRPGSKKFEAAKKERRKKLHGMLAAASDKGGSIAVSMGYNSDTGHVNYVQAWGTPKVDGVDVEAEDLARLHMNYSENSATSSAWNNDRVQEQTINTEKMTEGLTAIRAKLETAGKKDQVKEVDRLMGLAQAATDLLTALCQKRGYKSIDVLRKRAEYALPDILEDPEYLAAVRLASSEVMAWTKSSLELVHDETADPENIVVMPSNTERDDSVSDNEEDREQVGGGKVGEQARGSANASDASYFVPLDMMAGGWDGKEENADGYKAATDPDDQFIMLSSMTIAVPRTTRSRNRW